MTKLEEVARDLEEHWRRNFHRGIPIERMFEGYAKVAIEAIRVPSEGMRLAGAWAHKPDDMTDWEYQQHRRLAVEAYQAMIDAILDGAE